MLSPQIYTHSFISGMDYYFHMSRTYETAMQIKTGHFSYFLSLFSWHHNARIVNALYGPVGGYISGLILLLTKSWYNWEICIFMLALTLAGGTMYHLCRYWHVKQSISFLIGVIYMLSNPLYNFIFLQEFSGFAASLVPLIVLMMSEMLHEKDISPVKFALVIVIVVEVHLMTFVLSMTFVIPCVLIGVIVSNHKIRLIRHVLEAGLLTILLSFNEWASIIEVFGSNLHHIVPTFPGQHLGDRPSNSIMNVYPWLKFSQTPSLLGFCGALLLVVALILWLLKVRHLNYVINIYMLFGLFFIWLSSGWFPWAFVSHYAGAICSLIQFPRRFLPIGLILIYLTLGIILSKSIPRHGAGLSFKWLASMIMLLFFIGGIGLMNNTTYQTEIQAYHSSKVIHWTNMHRTAKRNPKRLQEAY